MDRVLLLGATGLVGGELLALLHSDARVKEILAPTRKPLLQHPKLINPVTNRLNASQVMVGQSAPDALICTLGTTIGKAGSKAAFLEVDYALPMAFATRCHAVGTRSCAIVTAVGASASSMFFYAKTKGEVERDIALIGFHSLTAVRPLLIEGMRDEERSAEGAALKIAGFLRPILPKGFQPNPAPRIARALIESVLAGKPGITRIYSQDLV